MKMGKTVKNHLFLWKLCFKTAPRFMIYHIYDGFRLKGSIFLEHTLGIYFILDCAEHRKPFTNALFYIGILLLIQAIQLTFDGYYQNSMLFKYKPQLYRALKEKMYAKAEELDLSCYDDPTYYNDFVLSVAESQKAIDRFLEMLNTMSGSITSIILTGGFFIIMNPTGLVFVLISFVLTYLFGKLSNKLNYNIQIEENPLMRETKYTERVFYLNDYAKEIRLNPQMGDMLFEDFDHTMDQVLEIEKKNVKKRIFFGFLRNYISGDFITDGLYIAYLVFQAAVLHTISYSAAVVLFNRVGTLKNDLRQFSDVLPRAYENSLYIDKLMEFLAYEPEIHSEGGLPVPEGPAVLAMENVSFAYNEKDGDILRGVTMILHPEEKVALVGYNGAGKTTLIKVLMRLYEPTSGRITLNGTDIREYNLREYRERIGVIFQDFKIYGATLRENVMLEDKETDDHEDVVIRGALDESGFRKRLQSLPNNLDTELTTEFDENGVNLSGGESQKVAISRVFYKNSQVMIMDEPSSALDPIAEYGLNKAMHKAAKEKSVVYISHRLSTTRDADHIYMLEKGKIIEEGSHDELLAKNGKYAEMWEAQAGKYRLDYGA